MRDKQIVEDLTFLYTFESLGKALQEVSIIKMQAVREAVLRARQFHDGLTQAYKDVRTSVKYDPEKVAKILKPQKERICVMLTANSTMYGNLTDQVYYAFRDYIKANDKDDIIIIGKIGADKYNKESFKRDYTYYDLQDADKTYLQMLKIINDLVFYETVTIFYGRFINIYTQEVAHRTLPGNMLKELLGDTVEAVTPDMLFLLEPTAEDLEAFFAKQIMGLLFRQSVFEFELARHAARVTTLEKSLDNTAEQLKKAIRMYNKVKRDKGGATVARTIALFGKKSGRRK